MREDGFFVPIVIVSFTSYSGRCECIESLSTFRQAC